jgi:hypothetical protein
MPGWLGAAGHASERPGGADSDASGRRSPAGGPASRVAAESRAARPLGAAPGDMAGVVGVVNRCQPDRRELARMPALFQRLRREGPRGCPGRRGGLWRVSGLRGGGDGLGADRPPTSGRKSLDRIASCRRSNRGVSFSLTWARRSFLPRPFPVPPLTVDPCLRPPHAPGWWHVGTRAAAGDPSASHRAR